MRTLRFLVIARAGRVARIGGRARLRLTQNPSVQLLYDRIIAWDWLGSRPFRCSSSAFSCAISAPSIGGACEGHIPGEPDDRRRDDERHRQNGHADSRRHQIPPSGTTGVR
jgi:hypothetical protein